MHDVVVVGGGLAGLTVARQLRRELPALSVVVVERTSRPLPEAAHKVGESSVELGSRYFDHELGLGEYLHERHLIKNGLRYFPGGGATLPLEDRTEIGPPQLPLVPSFQIDRGRFENDLRAMCEDENDVELIEGIIANSIELGEDGEAHRVTLADGRTLEGRWLIDATGRRRMLARQLGLTKPSGHEAHAAWFRVKGRLDVGHLVPEEATAWHNFDFDNIRWLSTSHLMGRGYWVWIIPLSSGLTSIGIVAHGEVHEFSSFNTLERALAWMGEFEPVMRAKLDEFEVADFRCIKDYSYTTERCFSADRWACVGEAGLFVDPFYSPGSDFIALSNSFAVELIRREIAKEKFEETVEYYDWFYRRLAVLSTETYKHAADAYGEPRVLAAKIYWDNFNYWAFVCQYYFQGIWRLELDEIKKFDGVAERFADLNLRAQALLREWGKRANDPPVKRYQFMPPTPSSLASLHLDLAIEMTPQETLAYMDERANRSQEVLTELLLRAVTELGPEGGAEMVDALGAADWAQPHLAARVEVEVGGKRGRRRRLSKTARDVERGLGPVATRGAPMLDVARALFKSHTT